MPPTTEDFNSLLPPSTRSDQLDRRTFIKTTLGTGFAAAALPAIAYSVIQTDSTGLSAGTISIELHGQSVPVYRAQPEGKSRLPVVLVISEIFGVHEHIADVARRFAKLGYLALAPELFVRQGDPRAYASVAELMEKVVYRVPDAQVMADLDACIAWAGAHGGDPERIGITGFCWGGRISWMYAAHNPNLKAGVAWYGRLLASASGNDPALTPRHPIDIAASLTVPVLGLYGGQDGGIPLASIEQMKTALAKGRSRSEFVVYPNSGHAFHADYRPSYVEADARDGWRRCLDWLRAHGVA